MQQKTTMLLACRLLILQFYITGQTKKYSILQKPNTLNAATLGQEIHVSGASDDTELLHRIASLHEMSCQATIHCSVYISLSHKRVIFIAPPSENVGDVSQPLSHDH